MFSVGDLRMMFEVRSPPDNYVSHALCSRIFDIRLFRVPFCLVVFASAVVYCRFDLTYPAIPL